MSIGQYDALLVVSFGGPEGREDVIPFLENVLRGRNVPHERMLEVAEHYYAFGGKSPINDQNRMLVEAIRQDFASHAIELPIYLGNRNWHPLLPDVLRQMANDGVKHSLAFFTSAFSSYSGCRQYRENIEQAQLEVVGECPSVEKLRHYFNHPRFIDCMKSSVVDSIGKLEPADRDSVQLVFTAHSIPDSMAQSSRYVDQLREASRLVAEACGIEKWDLVYQSRSGPPTQPWLEPDVCDYLRQLRREHRCAVVIVPIGFISDHMEVIYDLDTEAKDVCHEIDLPMVRAATPGTHPAFVEMIRDLVIERATGSTEKKALGQLGPSHDVCPVDCCPAPKRPPAR